MDMDMELVEAELEQIHSTCQGSWRQAGRQSLGIPLNSIMLEAYVCFGKDGYTYLVGALAGHGRRMDIQETEISP